MSDPLPTVNISGLDILRIGKWNGRQYTENDLDNLVDSFHKLKGVYDPPMKLGHNREQSLLTSDGLPAAGWIADLRRVGGRLVADVRDVPGKLAKVIQAGGYRKRSAELMFGVEIDGQKYPALLRAVSWLGADPPAVSGLSDVYEMYSDAAIVADETVHLEMSLDEIQSSVREAADKQLDHEDCKKDGAPNLCCWVRDMYQTFVVVSHCGDLIQFDYGVNADGDIEVRNPIKVKVAYVPDPNEDEENGIPDAVLSQAEEAKTTADPIDDKTDLEEGPRMDEKELRSILGIGDNEDLKMTLLSLKAQSVSLSDHTMLVEQMAELKAKMLTRDAEEMVDRAIDEGKIAPRQRDWAVTYCLSDESGFIEFLESAPAVVEFGSRGESHDLSMGDVTSTEATIAAKLGIDLDRMRSI